MSQTPSNDRNNYYSSSPTEGDQASCYSRAGSFDNAGSAWNGTFGSQQTSQPQTTGGDYDDVGSTVARSGSFEHLHDRYSDDASRSQRTENYADNQYAAKVGAFACSPGDKQIKRRHQDKARKATGAVDAVISGSNPSKTNRRHYHGHDGKRKSTKDSHRGGEPSH